MASPARRRYLQAIQRSRVLRDAAKRKPAAEKQIFYHASLAAGVAAWQTYLKELLNEFFQVTTDPTIAKYAALHFIVRENAQLALKRFNTPNWENARDLLLRYSGYDPAPDWNWHTRNLSGEWVKERLNQILQVRHSFAHGHPIPAFPWTQDAKGQLRLTVSALSENEALFGHLVRNTDTGIRQFLLRSYGLTLPW